MWGQVYSEVLQCCSPILTYELHFPTQWKDLWSEWTTNFYSLRLVRRVHISAAGSSFTSLTCSLTHSFYYSLNSKSPLSLITPPGCLMDQHILFVFPASEIWEKRHSRHYPIVRAKWFIIAMQYNSMLAWAYTYNPNGRGTVRICAFKECQLQYSSYSCDWKDGSSSDNSPHCVWPSIIRKF